MAENKVWVHRFKVFIEYHHRLQVKKQHEISSQKQLLEELHGGGLNILISS